MKSKEKQMRAVSPDSSIIEVSTPGNGIFTCCRTEPLSDQGKRIQLFKMILLTLLPILCVWAFTVYSLSDTVYSNQDTKEAKATMEAVLEVGELVHRVQKERDMSALYLSALGATTKTFLLKEYSLTDDAIANLTPWPSHISRKEANTKAALMAHISLHRNSMDLSLNNVDTEVIFYSSIIKVFLSWLVENIIESGFGSIWKTMVAYQKIARGKDAFGVERALGSMFYIKGGFPTWDHFEKYNREIHIFKYNYKSAVYYSDIVDPLYTYKIMSQNRNVSDTIAKFRQEIRNHQTNVSYFSMHKAQWLFENMTKYVDELLMIQREVSSKISEKIDGVIASEIGNITLYSVLLVIVILICPVIMFSVEALTSNIQRYALTLVNKTQELNLEKRKTDSLLYQMLPRPIAENLKNSMQVDAEYFKSVTIMFTDIFDFTKMTTEISPMELVEFLNSLYTAFDGQIDEYDVYKVETINDCYMVASGLPTRNGNEHALEIASLALDLMLMVKTKTSTFSLSTRRSVNLRIGINTGPCMAGIVGNIMLRYCLFGDTVNVASRMKSYGLPKKIHVSESTHTTLSKTGGFRMKFRGNIEVKGKGNMKTFWLLDRNDHPSESDPEDTIPGEIKNYMPPEASRNLVTSLGEHSGRQSGLPGPSYQERMQAANTGRQLGNEESGFGKYF